MPLLLGRLLPERRRLPALLAAALIVMTAGVWISSDVQRMAASRAAGRAHNAEVLLTAMLDQETGLRGYLLSNRRDFLQPYDGGRRAFAVALADARNDSRGDSAARRLVDRQASVATTWERLAEQRLTSGKASSAKMSVRAAVVRKSYMDAFRAANATYARLLDARRASQMNAAVHITVAVIAALALAFGALGMYLIRRARRGRGREQEFTQTLQVMRSEREAHQLLRGYMERSINGSRVTVLTRNNSADRLEASTALDAGDPLSAALEEAEPDTCLAIRLAKPHARGGGAEPLLACELCGKSKGGSLCQPLLVGGEVLGSVLLRKDSAPTPAEGDRLALSVSRSAPALANLRNLAIAEARAQTDPLTNLANKRAIHDTLKRMQAHAARTGDPLSVVVVDLDHFKRINDTYGHDRGDEALAAAADALRGTTRASDFVGRMGGEEFIVLLPDTDPDLAAGVAEKLRDAIASLKITDLHDGLTASFGVAGFPEHAVETSALLRLADRALYMAKKLGRNRVEVAQSADARRLSEITTT